MLVLKLNHASKKGFWWLILIVCFSRKRWLWLVALWCRLWFMKHSNMFTFAIISQYGYGIGELNSSSWMPRTRISCVVNTMVADDLAAKGMGHQIAVGFPSYPALHTVAVNITLLYSAGDVFIWNQIIFVLLSISHIATLHTVLSLIFSKTECWLWIACHLHSWIVSYPQGYI